VQVLPGSISSIGEQKGDKT